MTPEQRYEFELKRWRALGRELATDRGMEKPKTKCKGCSDKGYYFIDNNSYPVVKPCPCRKPMKRKKALKESGFPEIYHDLDVQGYIGRDTAQDTAGNLGKLAQEDARRWLTGGNAPEQGLLVYDPVCGSGKTYFLASVFAPLVEPRSTDIWFVECGQISLWVQAVMSVRKENPQGANRELLLAVPQRMREAVRNGGGPMAVLSFLFAPKILILDDLNPGKVKNGETLQNWLEQIVKVRQAQGFPTYITTNHTPQEFEDAFGERAWSRLKSRCKQVPMGGVDYRNKPTGWTGNGSQPQENVASFPAKRSWGGNA